MIRIITDSAADFEPEELERLNITCIPLTVIFGQDEYRENETLSKKQFYELLLSHEEPPRHRPKPCWTCSQTLNAAATRPFISPCPPP